MLPQEGQLLLHEARLQLGALHLLWYANRQRLS